MKKIILLIISFLIISVVYAQETYIYFFPEGGSTTSSGFIVDSDMVKLYDGTYYATYDSNDTIRNLQSINNNLFVLEKKGYILTPGKEWYAFDDDGNKHYFSSNSQYRITDIMKEVGISNSSIIMIDLHANWKVPDDPNKQKEITSISLDKNTYSLVEDDTFRLIVSYLPVDASKVSISWSSSNNKIATVNNTGKVKALKKGTATITAKTSNGKTASCQITVLSKKATRVNFQYHINGGTLAAVHDKEITVKDGFIYYKGKKEVHSLLWDNTLGEDGLLNYNNPSLLNITRKNYSIINVFAWNTKKDGTGKSFSESKVYKASDFCDASKKDCTIVLYANWKKTKNLINITLNTNGGTLDPIHSSNIIVNNNIIYYKGNDKYINLTYDSSLSNTGLNNYNNPNFINITKTGYQINKDEEWNTKSDGTGKSYSQSKVYKGSDFCSNKNEGCEVTLYANWKPSYVTKDIDLVLLWGQSNMVGYPVVEQEIGEPIKDNRNLNESLYNSPDNPYDDDIIANYQYMNYERYYINPNTAWEYKYNTDSMVDLYNNGNNLRFFGEEIIAKENNIKASMQSYGTNMLPYFAKTYTSITGHKVVIVQAGIGGRQIECFLPNTNKKDYQCHNEKRYMYEYIVKKYKNAIKYLQRNGYTIRNKFYIVCHGGANATKSLYGNYYNHFLEVHNNLKKDLGIEFGSIVYGFYKPDQNKTTPKCTYVDKVHEAQTKLIKNNNDIMLASDWGYKRYTEGYLNAFGSDKHTFTKNGKSYEIKDNRVHLTSASYSKVGVESAINVSKRVLNKSYDTSNTGYTKNCN